jgi:hypothetical protein
MSSPFPIPARKHNLWGQATLVKRNCMPDALLKYG